MRRLIPGFLLYALATMLVGLLQQDPLVGDLEGNLERAIAAARDACDRGATLLVGGELGLIGYPPRDLLLREGVVESCERAASRFAASLPSGVAALVGLPRRDDAGRLFNSVACCRDGAVQCFFDKRLLPTYDVFDELRHFTPGDAPVHCELDGMRVGVLVCEDLWRGEDVSIQREYADDPVAAVNAAGCDLLVCLSASPFVLGKRMRHVERLADVAALIDAPVVAVNQVGGNDDVVFAGSSMVMLPGGALLHESPAWREDVAVVDLAGSGAPPTAGACREEELFNALRLGIADYCRKTGHDRALVALSGGIDSAVVATLAAAALGPEQVTGVLMPSMHSSQGSLDDARVLATNLGLAAAHELPISNLHASTGEALVDAIGEPHGVTDENIQARLRGLLLMAIANHTGSIALTTGNKSELAVGYCTLYGDMCGGLAVIGDVLKMQVYDLARWINREFATAGFDGAPIPVASIEKPPSAELRPDQKDTDSLPPYEVLDAIVRLRIEEERSLDAIVGLTDIDRAVVQRFIEMIDRNEHKRHQAPIVLKVSPRAFGRGRPMPMAARWVPLSD